MRVRDFISNLNAKAVFYRYIGNYIYPSEGEFSENISAILFINFLLIGVVVDQASKAISVVTKTGHNFHLDCRMRSEARSILIQPKVHVMS